MQISLLNFPTPVKNKERKMKNTGMKSFISLIKHVFQ